jgi:hypothetical protein
VKHTTHTPRFLVTGLLAPALGLSVGAMTARADDRPAPAFGVAALGGVIERPAPAYNLNARTASVVEPPHFETSVPTPRVVSAPVVATAPTGFDWLAAGIGTAVGFGLAVLSGLMLLAGRRRPGLFARADIPGRS